MCRGCVFWQGRLLWAGGLAARWPPLLSSPSSWVVALRQSLVLRGHTCTTSAVSFEQMCRICWKLQLKPFMDAPPAPEGAAAPAPKAKTKKQMRKQPARTLPHRHRGVPARKEQPQIHTGWAYPAFPPSACRCYTVECMTKLHGVAKHNPPPSHVQLPQSRWLKHERHISHIEKKMPSGHLQELKVRRTAHLIKSHLLGTGAKFEVVADAFHPHLPTRHFSHLLTAAKCVNEFVL